MHSALLISCNSLWIFQDSTGGYMVAFAGQKYAAISSPAFVANSTYTVTSFTLVRIDVNTCNFYLNLTSVACIWHYFCWECRFLHSRRVGCKTCIGRETAVLHARATLALCAWITRIVQSKQTAVRTKGVLWIAASGYNWHSPALISTRVFSTPGMKWVTFGSTPSMAFIRISRVL